MMTRRRALLLALAALPASPALALFHGPSGAVFTDGGLAIRGTDPVAYFTEGRPVAGDRGITYDWMGATWAFASEANRDRFAANPEAYAPQYGGFCAWAVAAKGSRATTQPENWAIVDGRLFLNYDDRVQATWNADRPGFIAAADRRWPELRDE
ncbi:YHS domain-containing (seleno)protein [Jannaschia sp. W003]|uniref:YHS domain-containing (seleno)protein n=1 Tax=Jannaschia sp. W003 TaxID=2867012 RepID=UPI0021A6BD76|nr:YHS domain-containing (seleno)protein [Jannaschia sp. W003]UWQ20382.1 YHS domain-containing protein [Jannaschia sp. W003]